MGYLQFDENLVVDVAARLDLRSPNEAGVREVVRALDAAEGFVETVVDVATGVGKTYMAVGIVEYAAAQGIRNVLIVTPSSRVQAKTLRNFTPGDRKYVGGSEFEPVVITPDNFATGEIGSAIHDPSRLKVFIFNVQQLLRPTADTSRKTRAVNENLGSPLYDHLRDCEDLLVIADEHHIYRPKARSFNAAIADLHPRAMVGLTATPEPGTEVVYQYTLGQAIYDELVKVPVIAYRKDGIRDQKTQLSDACRLLDAKTAAYRDFVAAVPGVESVKPVLFVVCADIQHAQDVAQILAGSGFIGGADAVLEVNSDSSDEALAALDAVEEPDSPVRAIVSVNMLKEGWDVKNIAVIVGLRRLASQTLTEQVLGRGLRLPFGKRTGFPMVDQIDIVAHDSWEQLLAQKEILIARAIKNVSADGTTPVEGGAVPTRRPEVGSEEASHPSNTSARFGQPASEEEADVQARRLAGGDEDGTESLFNGEGDTGIRAVDLCDSSRALPPPSPVIVKRREKHPNSILFPRWEPTLEPTPFRISQVLPEEVRQAGARFAVEFPTTVVRKSINVERLGTDDELSIAVRQESSHQFLTDLMPVSEVRRNLVERVRQLRQLEKTRAEVNGVRRIVAEFLSAAGVTDDEAEWSTVRVTDALDALEDVVRNAIRSRKYQQTYRIRPVEVPVDRIVLPPGTKINDLSVPFSKLSWYRGWARSLFDVASFHAKSTEWKLVDVLDSSDRIDWWLRAEDHVSAEIRIALPQGGNYYPDFVARDTDGTYWVLEGKSDKEAGADDVTAKRATAEEWARFVTDDGRYGTWRYLFATETHLKNTTSWEQLLAVTGPA